MLILFHCFYVFMDSLQPRRRITFCLLSSALWQDLRPRLGNLALTTHLDISEWVPQRCSFVFLFKCCTKTFSWKQCRASREPELIFYTLYYEVVFLCSYVLRRRFELCADTSQTDGHVDLFNPRATAAAHERTTRHKEYSDKQNNIQLQNGCNERKL